MKEKFITVRNKQVLKRIELSQLNAIVGDSYCSTFLLENEEKFTCTKTLKHFESILPPPTWLRVSKNAILNSKKIVSVEFENRIARLENGKEFSVSVSKMKELTKVLETIN
jgi:DNA-binding LytR/AlgR family response regulator